MVAISLYRGNLHRVPDIPRRWPMPTRAISLPQFRRLMLKRSRTISRISSRNPNIIHSSDFSGGKDKLDGMGENEAPEAKLENLISSVEPSGSTAQPLPNDEREVKMAEDNEEPKRPEKEAVGLKEVRGSSVGDGIGSSGDGKQEEVIDNLGALDDKEARKTDLQNKLHTLNERKHYLVQMLKQILNAEEEIKRRSAQSSLTRSPVPIQPETPVDLGRAARNPPKMSVNVNFGDTGGESDAGVNRSNQTRQWPHMHSVSPPATSVGRNQHGPFQSNMAHAPRGGMLHHLVPSSLMAGSTASPSRFASAGHHCHPTTLPLAAAASGAHLAASSPSASGGASSAFGDAR